MSEWSRGAEIAFYATICALGVLSAVCSAWIASQCRNIDTKYSDFGMTDAMMLRVHVFWMSTCNFLYILHYIKFIPLWIDDDVYDDGIGKYACTFIAMYGEFFLVATISWYFCITILLAQNYLDQPSIPYYIQKISVLAISILFTFIPFAIETRLDHVFGRTPLDEDFSMLDCNLLYEVELPHNILLTFYLACSIITMLLGIIKLQKIIFLSRDFEFIAKLLAFTVVFVLTYIWRPMAYFSGINHLDGMVFTTNAFLAFSGIGNWMVWVPQIKFQVRETQDLSTYFSVRHSRLSIDETISNRRISRSIRISKHHRQDSGSIQSIRRHSWSDGDRAEFEKVAGSSYGSVIADREGFLASLSPPTSAPSSSQFSINKFPVNLGSTEQYSHRRQLSNIHRRQNSNSYRRQNSNSLNVGSQFRISLLDDDRPAVTPRPGHKRSLSANSEHIATFFGWSCNSQEDFDNLLRSPSKRGPESKPSLHKRSSSDNRGLHKRMTSSGSLKLLDNDFLASSPAQGISIFPEDATEDSPPMRSAIVSLLKSDDSLKSENEYSPPRIPSSLADTV